MPAEAWSPQAGIACAAPRAPVYPRGASIPRYHEAGTLKRLTMPAEVSGPQRDRVDGACEATWDNLVVNDYMVAAHDSRRPQVPGESPQVKHHAYLDGATTTACGFGLMSMRLFSHMRFSRQEPAMRCPICSRMVGAGDRDRP
jgi:hypothetical protein